MMRRLVPIALWAAMMISVGCGDNSGTPKPLISSFYGFRHDIRTITVSVPAMGSAECSKRIQDALAKTEGIRATRPDIANRKVEVEYDAIKLGIRNIQYVIAGAGFDADDTAAPADTKKNLPAECR